MALGQREELASPLQQGVQGSLHDKARFCHANARERPWVCHTVIAGVS